MIPQLASETQSACELLRYYSCLDREPQASEPDRLQLQQALQTVIQVSDYQILGICADTLAAAELALQTYAAVLGYPLALQELNLEAVEGAAYIKFNPKSSLCYASPYQGSYRGVLVSCQSDDETGLNEMFGHLPLDLFMPAEKVE